MERTYVLFNKKTGDIVQIHTAVAISGEPLPVSREDLVALYRPQPGKQLDPGDLDVLEVNQELLLQGLRNRKKLYIDVQRRVLSERPA